MQGEAGPGEDAHKAKKDVDMTRYYSRCLLSARCTRAPVACTLAGPGKAPTPLTAATVDTPVHDKPNDRTVYRSLDHQRFEKNDWTLAQLLNIMELKDSTTASDAPDNNHNK